jgi:ribosomal protein L3 glutamine methyltransferase
MEKTRQEQAILELVTLRDFIRFAVSEFTIAGIYCGHGTDNVWDEAIYLCLHSLHVDSEYLSSFLDARLILSERQAILHLIARRVNERLPAPYLTKQAWFAGLNFYIDDRVLIPRSPVAELIDKQFTPWVNPDKVHRILDIGTGSACIAIACAYAFEDAQVDAVDISEDALAVAAINVQNHHLLERVRLIRSDLFSALVDEKYDLVIANIPYVDKEDMMNLPKEYQHEPELALAAGEDGLRYIYQILLQAREHLTEQGILVGEVGNSAPALEEAFPELSFTWIDFERGGEGVFVISHAELEALTSGEN